VGAAHVRVKLKYVGPRLKRALELIGQEKESCSLERAAILLNPSPGEFPAHGTEISTSRDLPGEEFCPKFAQVGIPIDLVESNPTRLGINLFLKSSDRGRDPT
jgi:hypothetical protein